MTSEKDLVGDLAFAWRADLSGESHVDSRSPARHAIGSVSCGRDHTLALLDNGRVFGWGGDGSGRMPAGAPEYCSTFKADGRAVEVNTQHEFVAVAAGYGISLGVTATKRVAVWGANAAGIGGRREAIAPATTQLLGDIEGACAVAATEYLFGAVDAAGTVHTWGLNHEGALGRPTHELNAVPGPSTAVPPVGALSLGRGYMLALTRDGRLVAWGSNAAGQLGVGHLTSLDVPRAVLSLEAAFDRGGCNACAGAHRERRSARVGQQPSRPTRARARRLLHNTFARRSARRRTGRRGGNAFLHRAGGKRACLRVGLERSGATRPGRYRRSSRATRVPGLGSVRSIAAGQTHAVALTAGGLVGWGDNTGGQIGALATRQFRPARFFAVG